jgi:alanine dehydrogenase
VSAEVEDVSGDRRDGVLVATLRVLSRENVARLLDLEKVAGDLEQAFISIATGGCQWPERTGIDIDGDRLLTMSAYAEPIGLGLKCVSSFPSNPGNGLPAHQGLVALFDPDSGTPVCILDASQFTAMRTAACSAVAARTLARHDSSRLAIIGSGDQARAHLRVLSELLDLEEIRIAARNPARAASLAGGVPGTTVSASVEDAVRGADIVALCTASPVAVLEPTWLAPGAHVSSVGCAPPEGELGPVLARAGRLFVESLDALRPPPVGAPDLRDIGVGGVTLLGNVLAGADGGRRSWDELTVFKSCGHALEDVAMASALYRAGLDHGAGVDVQM